MDLSHTSQIIVLSARMKALEESLDALTGTPSKEVRYQRVKEIVCQLMEACEDEIPRELHAHLQESVEKIVGTCGEE